MVLHLSIPITWWSVLLITYIFWWFYLGCAALYLQWHTKALAMWVKILATPGGLLFLFADVIYLNAILGTILFLQWPPNGCYTLTERLTSYLHTIGWRSKVAHVICQYLLNPFEIGGHCK